MSRKFYVVTAILTSLALLLCLIHQIVIKNWLGVIPNVIWLFANNFCYITLNRAETIRKIIEEHEKRDNESEN